MYLEGSVEIAGDKIRVIVQLINSADGFHILSRTFDHQREDFFTIRDEITKLTVSALRVTLPKENSGHWLQLWTATQAWTLMCSTGVALMSHENQQPQRRSPKPWGGLMPRCRSIPSSQPAYAGKCSVLASRFRVNDDPANIRLAETACSSALELNPNLDVVHTALGGLYVLTGRYSQSAAAYLEALRINKKNVQSLTGLAEVYRLQQRPAEAEETLRSAIGMQPGNWAPYNALGYFLFRQGRFTEAAAEFANVVEIDSQNVRGIGNIASSYMMAGQFELAAPAYQRAIDIEPDTASFSNLGLMYYYLGQYEEAAEAMRNALVLAPKARLFWSNLGDILFNDGDFAAAHEAFTKAEELANAALLVNPNDPAAMMDLAWIYAMLGEEQQALSLIQRAADALPDDPYANYIQGLIQHRAGNIDAALDAFDTAEAKGYSRTILASRAPFNCAPEPPAFQENHWRGITGEHHECATEKSRHHQLR